MPEYTLTGSRRGRTISWGWEVGVKISKGEMLTGKTLDKKVDYTFIFPGVP